MVVEVKGTHMSFVWVCICIQAVVGLVFCQAFQGIIFQTPLNGLERCLLICKAEIVALDESMNVRKIRHLLDIEQRWCKHRSMGQAIFLRLPSAFPSINFDIKTSVCK